MYKELFTTKYHPKLVDMMLKASHGGTFSVNILTPMLLSALLYNYIQRDYIISWIILNIIIYFTRLTLTSKASIANKKQDLDVTPYLHKIFIVIFLSAMLYGYALWYSVSYVSEMQLLFMAMITITMVSGSIATLGSVFPAFFIYVVFNLFPIIIVFIFKGGEIFYTFAFAIFVYMFIMLKNGLAQFRALEENILLKESFEGRVEKSIGELKKKEKLLYEQSRLAQMGEMISMIAHQWRQPLNAISATSSSLQLRAKLDKLDQDFVIEMTENIATYSQHLSDTIDDFRNFFKPNKEKDTVSFTKIIDAVESIMQHSLKNHNIKLVKELNCEEEFSSYANELKQVVLNLVKNAEDILMEKNIEEPYIKIATKVYGDKFILEVSDNGGGIPKEALYNIFNPYFSTKKQKDGTGLGLYMSKVIVEEHCKGKLRGYNSDDGAVFVLTIGSL
jgi:signal transduction histidine kinase